MAFYCLEIISKDRNGLKLEKVGPTLIRFPQKSLVSYFHSDLLYCLTIQRFQGSMDYFEDSLMFVRWPTTAIHKYILYYYILYLSTKTSSLVVRVYLPVQ